MRVESIASGSSGNCFAVSGSSGLFLLEAGITWKRILKGVNFKPIDFILVSHEHQDHCKGIKDALKYGNKVYSSPGTASVIGGNKLETLQVNKIDSFQIIPFDLFHDAVEPTGFFIKETETNETLLFATDTRYVKSKFGKIDILVIECNHSKELISDTDRTNTFNHMEFQTTKNFIAANNITQEIHLIHLSERYSEPNRYMREIQEMTGLPVYAH